MQLELIHDSERFVAESIYWSFKRYSRLYYIFIVVQYIGSRPHVLRYYIGTVDCNADDDKLE